MYKYVHLDVQVIACCIFLNKMGTIHNFYNIQVVILYTNQ